MYTLYFLEYFPGGIINFKRGNDPGYNQGRDIFKAWEYYKL